MKKFFSIFASDASEKHEKGNDSRHLRFGGKFGGNGGKCPKWTYCSKKLVKLLDAKFVFLFLLFKSLNP